MSEFVMFVCVFGTWVLLMEGLNRLKWRCKLSSRKGIILVHCLREAVNFVMRKKLLYFGNGVVLAR